MNLALSGEACIGDLLCAVSEFLVRRAAISEAPPITAMARDAIRQSAAAFYSATQIETCAAAWSADGIEHERSETVSYVADADGEIVGFASLHGGAVDQLYVRSMRPSRRRPATEVSRA
jgi:hypothetical protein